MSDGYNGWANWETWNIMLWIQDCDGVYDHMVEYANELFNSNEDDDDIQMKVRKYAESYIEELFFGEITMEKHGGPVFDACYHGYLKSIDWYEIADHVIADAKEGLV